MEQGISVHIRGLSDVDFPLGKNGIFRVQRPRWNQMAINRGFSFDTHERFSLDTTEAWRS